VLKGYGEVDPQYPERIFKMAEAYSAAEVKERNTESFAIILGMMFEAFVEEIAKGSHALSAILKEDIEKAPE
jgi:hypothetical protein